MYYTEEVYIFSDQYPITYDNAELLEYTNTCSEFPNIDLDTYEYAVACNAISCLSLLWKQPESLKLNKHLVKKFSREQIWNNVFDYAVTSNNRIVLQWCFDTFDESLRYSTVYRYNSLLTLLRNKSYIDYSICIVDLYHYCLIAYILDNSLDMQCLGEYIVTHENYNPAFIRPRSFFHLDTWASVLSCLPLFEIENLDTTTFGVYDKGTNIFQEHENVYYKILDQKSKRRKRG